MSNNTDLPSDYELEQIKNAILEWRIGIPLFDNPIIKEKIANLAVSIFKSKTTQESLQLIKNFRLFHGPIPELQANLISMKERIAILENHNVFNEIEFIITEYTCLIAEEKIRRKFRKPLKEIIFSENNQSPNHPSIDYFFKEFISKLPFAEISDAIRLFRPFNELMNNLDEDFITPAEMSKAGRKDQALEQEFVFNLRNALKKYDKEYMGNMILILGEVKSLSPIVFSDLPYLNPDSLRKAIERGSKLKSHRLTLNSANATK